MKHVVTFLYAVLAGVAISIGGAAFLSVDDRAVGAALFSVGLFAVCTLGLNLFTGKICYIFHNPPSYLVDCALIWLGNLAGALLAGGALRVTRLTALVERAQVLSETKLSDQLPSVFVLAVFCNILIYLAVESYKNCPYQLGKFLGLFLGVAVFVVAGFEHCVANMFYFTAGGAWSGRAALWMAVMTAGNAVGGVIFPLCGKLKAQVEKSS